jgi:hypothetical protein
MAWRPSQYLIEGELDNTTPGQVTGWMQFAGVKDKVTFDLKGNFHRDIRGAKVHLTGDGQSGDPEAAEYMDGFVSHQTGETGDMTAGLPPYDYTKNQPYFEVYGDDNGRIVIELEPSQVKVIGRPIPACESDPISRAEQSRKMANFLAGLSAETQVPAIAVGDRSLVSDPTFTHWVVAEDQIIGEARGVEPDKNGTCFAYVRLFQVPEVAEHGRIEKKYLRAKAAGLAGDTAAGADGFTEGVQP